MQKRFINLDAYEQRQQLTLEAIEWIEEGFKSTAWVNCFRCRVRILAKRAGLKVGEVFDDILADARIAVS